MSDDQERRISDLERHVERLYGVTTTAGERLAVAESQMKSLVGGLKEARDDFRIQMAAMQADLKQTISDQQDKAHKRTVLVLTLGLGAITIIVNVAGVVLR